MQTLSYWTPIGKDTVENDLYHPWPHSFSNLSTTLSQHLNTHQFFSAFGDHNTTDFDLWHNHLGHIFSSRLSLIQDPIVISQVNSKKVVVVFVLL